MPDRRHRLSRTSALNKGKSPMWEIGVRMASTDVIVQSEVGIYVQSEAILYFRNFANPVGKLGKVLIGQDC